MNTDLPDIPEETSEDVVPGGGPAEGEETHAIQMPNPEAVHPDYQQTVPGDAAPAPTVPTGTTEESGSSES
jgi:hypothetical protein